MPNPEIDLLFAHLDVLDIGGPKHLAGDSPEYDSLRVGCVEDSLCDHGYGRQEIEEVSERAAQEAQRIKAEMNREL